MDIMKVFTEEYLPKWSEEKHLPIPTLKHPDKWNVAWEDFLTEYMEEHYEEIANEYRNLPTKVEQPFYEFKELPKEEKEEPVKKSNWELVQEKRKKK